MTEACSSCRFWRRAPNAKVGPCRRHAPGLGKWGRASWPETREDDACGSWKAAGGPAPRAAALPVHAAGVA